MSLMQRIELMNNASHTILQSLLLSSKYQFPHYSASSYLNMDKSKVEEAYWVWTVLYGFISWKVKKEVDNKLFFFFFWQYLRYYDATLSIVEWYKCLSVMSQVRCHWILIFKWILICFLVTIVLINLIQSCRV